MTACKLPYYKASDVTAAASRVQTQWVVGFLGQENLNIIKTPGTAAKRELTELSEAGVKNSRIQFIERLVDVSLPASVALPSGNQLQTKHADIFREIISNPVTPGPTWIDYDFTVQPTTIVMPEYWKNFVHATTRVIALARDKVVCSLTVTRRSRCGSEARDRAFAQIDEFLNSFSSTHRVESNEQLYSSRSVESFATKDPRGPGSPMIRLNYFYTPL